jgi:hypothetical protein
MSHLEDAKQTYLMHMKDSLLYRLSSLKASFYFFIHGLFPEFYKSNGSKEINNLNEIIKEKYN